MLSWSHPKILSSTFKTWTLCSKPSPPMAWWCSSPNVCMASPHLNFSGIKSIQRASPHSKTGSRPSRRRRRPQASRSSRDSLGYYRRFIPNAASHLFHLFEALKGKPKTLEWTDKCQLSFDATKAALAAATLLHHPGPGSALALTTVASNVAIEGVLEQRGTKGWEP